MNHIKNLTENFLTIVISLLTLAVIFGASPAGAETTSAVLGQTEADEIDLANEFGSWVSFENPNHIALNFTQALDAAKASSPSSYTISSTDDPAFESVRPVKAGVSVRGLSAPLPDRKNKLTIAYRVFLNLPKDLSEGKHYTVTANIGTTASQFSFVWSGNLTNENIKVNQVGFLPEAEKLAYVGEYGGTLGAIPFQIPSFHVVDDVTGKTVWTGNAVLKWANNAYTGESTYVLDFSSFKTPGSYKIKVPGVGVSYAFRIGSDVYSEVLGVAMKGAYHARSGAALTADLTRFTHGVSHNLDATVMPHNPLPQAFIAKFGDKNYYPTSLSGQRLDVTKGHYDAGDYGKYTVNGAYFAANILAAFEAFPEKLSQDDLQIPESGNGIPDMLEEAKWELDWLENMQDPNDGGVFCIVKPDITKEFYENRKVDDPRNLPRQLWPKDTTCTGAYAAALAKAGRSTLVKKYYPEAAARYVSKAEKAWKFLESHPGYLGWHHYGTMEDASDKSMDDRVWAAIELFGATGNQKYQEFFLKNHKPEEARWSWIPLFGSNGQATLACAFMNSPVDPAMKERCRASVVAAGDMHVRDSEKQPYHLSLYDDPLKQKNFGWTFLQERIYQLVMADAISPKAAYKKAALNNWNYILGANPTSYSFITGIGSKRMREPVHTQSVFDGIEPPVPGIPIGLASSNSWIESYGKALSETYPSSFPALKLPYDSYNVVAEFVIPEVAQNIIAAAYFDSSVSAKNSPPSIGSVGASSTYGAVPLKVSFNPIVSDADGTIVRYFWDFGDGTYSFVKNPSHEFSKPYHQYQVTLTITDNGGSESYKTIVVETRPAASSFTTSEYSADDKTVALFHFNQDLKDTSGKLSFSVTGNAKLSSQNILWMSDRKGQSLSFTDLTDYATLSIPASAFQGEVVTIEAKIYVDEYVAYSRGTGEIFGIYQDWDRQAMLRDEKYAGQEIIYYAPAKQEKPLSGEALQRVMPKGEWHEIKFELGEKSQIVIDGKVAATMTAPLKLKESNKPVVVKIGGFKGFIDEIRVTGSGSLPVPSAPTSEVSPPALPVATTPTTPAPVIEPTDSVAVLPAKTTYDFPPLPAPLPVTSTNTGDNSQSPVLPRQSSEPLEIIVDSPESRKYDASRVNMRVRISRAGSCTYAIDGGAPQSMIPDWNNQAFSASATLANGSHAVVMDCKDRSDVSAQKSVSFSLGETIPAPRVIIDSPEKISYGTNTISFRFRMDRAGVCEYSLDGKTRKSMTPDWNNRGFSAKETLAGGSYTVTAFCRDSAGIENSGEKVSFIVPQSNPLSLIIDSPEKVGYGKDVEFRFRISRPGTCSYSLNDGSTLKSMIPDWNNQGFRAKESLASGSYTATAVCKDNEGTPVRDSVVFKVW